MAVYRDTDELLRTLRAKADLREALHESLPGVTWHERDERHNFAEGIRFAAMLIEDSSFDSSSEALAEDSDESPMVPPAAPQPNRLSGTQIEEALLRAVDYHGVDDPTAVLALGFLLLAERGTLA